LGFLGLFGGYLQRKARKQKIAAQLDCDKPMEDAGEEPQEAEKLSLSTAPVTVTVRVRLRVRV
jgi:hypothetical protein